MNTLENKGGTTGDNAAREYGFQTGAIEIALASALTAATTEGRFDVVGLLAKELEARRLARSAVVDLGAERARRGTRR